nr:uncharacterized protein LOC128704180 [Cherax quadricarinatus]
MPPESLVETPGVPYIVSEIEAFRCSSADCKVKEWLVEELNPELQKLADGWYFPDSTSPFDYLMTKVKTDTLLPFLCVTWKYKVKIFRGSGTLGIQEEIKIYSLLPASTTAFSSLLSFGGLSAYHGHGALACGQDGNCTWGMASPSRQLTSRITRVNCCGQVGAQQVKVTGEWWVPYLLGTGGHLEATIDTFSATFEVQQKVDMKSPAVLRTLDCQIGNMAVRTTGMGSLDYLVEAAVNILPNVFRNEIVKKFEPELWKVWLQGSSRSSWPRFFLFVYMCMRCNSEFYEYFWVSVFSEYKSRERHHQ